MANKSNKKTESQCRLQYNPFCPRREMPTKKVTNPELREKIASNLQIPINKIDFNEFPMVNQDFLKRNFELCMLCEDPGPVTNLLSHIKSAHPNELDQYGDLLFWSKSKLFQLTLNPTIELAKLQNAVLDNDVDSIVDLFVERGITVIGKKQHLQKDEVKFKTGEHILRKHVPSATTKWRLPNTFTTNEGKKNETKGPFPKIKRDYAAKWAAYAEAVMITKSRKERLVQSRVEEGSEEEASDEREELTNSENSDDEPMEQSKAERAVKSDSSEDEEDSEQDEPEQSNNEDAMEDEEIGQQNIPFEPTELAMDNLPLGLGTLYSALKPYYCHFLPLNGMEIVAPSAEIRKLLIKDNFKQVPLELIGTKFYICDDKSTILYRMKHSNELRLRDVPRVSVNCDTHSFLSERSQLSSERTVYGFYTVLALGLIGPSPKLKENQPNCSSFMEYASYCVKRLSRILLYGIQRGPPLPKEFTEFYNSVPVHTDNLLKGTPKQIYWLDLLLLARTIGINFVFSIQNGNSCCTRCVPSCAKLNEGAELYDGKMMLTKEKFLPLKETTEKPNTRSKNSILQATDLTPSLVFIFDEQNEITLLRDYTLLGIST